VHPLLDLVRRAVVGRRAAVYARVSDVLDEPRGVAAGDEQRRSQLLGNDFYEAWRV